MLMQTENDMLVKAVEEQLQSKKEMAEELTCVQEITGKLLARIAELEKEKELELEKATRQQLAGTYALFEEEGRLSSPKKE